MQDKGKKFISILACAGMLATSSLTVLTAVQSNSIAQTVNAKSVSARSYGIDVSAYQSTNVKSSATNGARFAIVKVSEGTGYRNAKAADQIKSAKANNMLPMAYHFALFGANSNAAVSEANYAAASAAAYGLPKGSYIACDWETGDGNNVNGGRDASANAIITFMKRIVALGYKPLLYSGASLLNNNINTAKVTSAFPNSLWVASYTTMGRIDAPDFGYFPSMNGVAIWQFTDNWRGLNIDGNISLLPLSYSSSASSQAPKASSIKNGKTVMHNSYVYNNSGEKQAGQEIKAYQTVQVLGGAVTIKGEQYYRIGDNSYIKLNNVDGVKKVLKHKAYIYTNRAAKVHVPVLKRGTTVPTYGKKTIKGKTYYKINKNRYVKTSNF